MIALQPSAAQLVPDQASDRNLGTTVQPVTPQLDLITGGTRPSNGINLFHSFSEFNVDVGRGVYFDTPTGVQNILTRVTGNTRSSILGILGTTGNANLFLLNPNGIIFGETAILDVRGSLIATTANSIRLGETGSFSASAPQNSVLLNINPSALLVNQLGRSGDMELNQASLGVPQGQSMAFVGGAVRMNGGILAASNGRVELGGLAESGTINFNQNAGQIALGFPANVARSNVSLTNNALIGVSGDGSGGIAIHARNFDLSNQSALFNGIFSNTQGTNQPGKITIDATDAVILQQITIGNLIGSNTVGNGGDIEIKTGTLSLLEGSNINTFHNGEGNGGSVMINARDRVTLDGANSIGNGSSITTLGLNGKGNSGDIRINSGVLELTNGGQLVTSSNRPGNSGNIVLNIRDRTTINGTAQILGLPSGIFAELSANGIGTAGNIDLTTPFLAITNGGQIRASTYGFGNSGNISINASDRVILDGFSSNASSLNSSSISSDVVSEQTIGNGGNIQIVTNSLFVKNGASISGSTNGQGNGGKIIIDARDQVTIDGQSQALSTQGNNTFSLKSAVRTIVLPNAIGNGGEIQITTGSLNVLNGALVTADTSGQGNGGNILIRARDRVLVDGTGRNGSSSNISSDVSNFEANGFIFRGLGNGGDVQIDANDLTVSNGAILSSLTEGQGKAGNINLTVNNALTVQGSSPIDSSQVSSIFAAAGSRSSGAGGNLRITASQVSVLDRGRVFVGNVGQGNAGTLNANANTIKLDNQAVISSSATSGNGGDIFLNAREVLLMRRGSFISTSAAGIINPNNPGNGGNININTTFLVSAPQENADIVANAIAGRGGNVTITAQGIFGFTPRSRSELVELFGTTDLTRADLDLLPTNDIIAISRENSTLSGRIELNLPDFDPSQGLVTLPTAFIDRANQITQSCRSDVTATRSSFINSGRGGVPASPGDTLSSSSTFDRWIALNPSPNPSSRQAKSSSPQSETGEPLMEAQDWVRDANGVVMLVDSQG